MSRHVTTIPDPARSDSTTLDADTQERLRFTLYVLCPCEHCDGLGRDEGGSRCKECRGEGKSLSRVAEAADERGIGAAFITCALEGQLRDCPIGLLDQESDPKWLVLPWVASPSERHLSAAGRVLRQAQMKGEK